MNKPTRREVTPERLQRSKLAIERRRQKVLASAPLFAGELAEQLDAEMPTPEKRLRDLDTGFLDFWKRHRAMAARNWRRGRGVLSKLEPSEAAAIRQAWQSCHHPADGTYFLEFVRAKIGPDRFAALDPQPLIPNP